MHAGAEFISEAGLRSADFVFAGRERRRFVAAGRIGKRLANRACSGVRDGYLAAGTTAPEGSLTAPEIDAETCAYRENVQKSTRQRSFMSCKEFSVIHKRQ